MLKTTRSSHVLLQSIGDLMKRVRLGGSVCAAVVLLSALPGWASAQTPASREDRVRQIDTLIVHAEAEVSSGKRKVLIGLGAYVAASAILYESPQAASAIYTAGSVAWIWGAFEWWSGLSDLSNLRTRRATMAFVPLIDLRHPRRMRYGVVMRVAF